MAELICGLEFEVAKPSAQVVFKRNRSTGQRERIAKLCFGAKPRFIVKGVTHKSGRPIRFKSLDGAERHIRNMRLAAE